VTRFKFSTSKCQSILFNSQKKTKDPEINIQENTILKKIKFPPASLIGHRRGGGGGGFIK